MEQQDSPANDENIQASNAFVIGDDRALEKNSLQNAFLRFREQKIREKNLMKACRDAMNGEGRTPEYKASLRQKFIDTAMKYLGVPYGIKFKADEDPVAPLYLDCCGLVRQVVKDLQEDFGFVIGKWNQAYQMDTLPIVLEESQLKPGDLIFYEGKYNSDRSKPQKHDNVHVEIFLGGETGEATIGSRYHRGKVSIFPSYKFHSTTWTLVRYHFRSLDTWLDGICKSHCSEHAWNSDSLNYLDAAGKRSIFSDERLEDDCSAGGEEIDEKGPAIYTEEDEEGGGDGDDEVQLAQAPVEAINSASIALSSNSADSVELVQDGLNLADKNSDPIAQQTESQHPEKGDVDTGEKVLKKPKRVSQFSVGSSKEKPPTGTDKVPRPSRASSKLSSDVSDKGVSASVKVRSSSPNASSNIDFRCAKSAKEGPRCYYLGKTNGWKLVRAAMDRRGWTMMPTEYHFSTRYGFKWVERRNQIDYLAHIPGQLVCHIPNNDVITTKIGMLCTLRDKYCRGPNARKFPPWLPHTYDLENPSDCAALLQEEERLLAGLPSPHKGGKSAKAMSALPKSPIGQPGNSDDSIPPTVPQLTEPNDENDSDDDDDVGNSDIKGGIWIYKPSCTNRGRGIRVITGLSALKELCYGKPMGMANVNGAEGDSNCTGSQVSSSSTSLPYKGIVQKYIRNPLLVTDEGRKFDIRCYLLIARNSPTTLAFYHPGYCRLALKPFSIATAANLEDNSVHLTNAAIQKKEAIYKEDGNKDLQIQTVDAIADDLDALGKSDNADFMRNELDNKIKLALVDVMKACNHILLKKHGYFDLLGCDFMVTDTNKLYMLEINTNPSLTLDNGTLANMLPDIVDGAIELVMQSQGPDRRPTDNDDFLKSTLPGKFSLIFDEATGYQYRGSKKKKST